jgi:hypothetical protein
MSTYEIWGNNSKLATVEADSIDGAIEAYRATADGKWVAAWKFDASRGGNYSVVDRAAVIAEARRALDAMPHRATEAQNIARLRAGLDEEGDSVR